MMDFVSDLESQAATDPSTSLAQILGQDMQDGGGSEVEFVEAYAKQPGENGYQEPRTIADGIKIKQDIGQEALPFGEPYTTPGGFRFNPAAGVGGKFEPAG
jgi:hypothetical protein